MKGAGNKRTRWGFLFSPRLSVALVLLRPRAQFENDVRISNTDVFDVQHKLFSRFLTSPADVRGPSIMLMHGTCSCRDASLPQLFLHFFA